MSAEPTSTAPPPVILEPERPRHRARRILKWTGIALAVLLLLVVLLPTLLSTSLGHSVIRSWLRGNVDQKVDYDSLDLGWFSGIEIEGLRVAEKDGDPLLEATLVTVDAPLFPMIWGKVHADRILVQDPVVYVTPEKDEDEPKKKEPGETKKEPRPEEPSEAPNVHAPVEVRNLTIVFRDEAGREARRGGIGFTGLIDTRGAPTTFRLDVPDGVQLAGEAKLFAADGTMLAASARSMDATLTIASLDAAKYRDVLEIMLPGTPVAGTLDGKVELHQQGKAANGTVDIRASHVGVRAGAATAASRSGDDLTVAGAFEFGDGRLLVKDWKVRADGLNLDADLAGTTESLDGTARVDADLARIAAKLRTIGFEFDGAVEGRLAGTMRFTPSPSKGAGEFALTGFRASGLVDGRPPVSIQDARVRFEAAPGKEAFELTSLVVELPDFSATAHGKRLADGTIDGEATAKGDLGGLLGRVRDLGSLPAAFSVSGDLDALVRVKGRKDALVVDVQRLVLSEKDVRIEASGTRAADGALDFRASGEGDLGNLFGRAAQAGAGPAGLADVKGRFEFQASAKGPASALVVEVPKLAVTGDLHLDAHARIAADGALDAEVKDLSGEVDDLLALAQRSGFLERALPVGGRIALTARVIGTRKEPEVPHATLKLSGGPLDVDATGSIGRDGVVAAQAKGAGDVDRLVALAHEQGWLKGAATTGCKLAFEATAEGPRDAIAVPSARLSLTGPLAAEVKGRMDGKRAFSADGKIEGALQTLLDLAAAFSGATAKRLDGTLSASFSASGTKEKYDLAVPSLALRAKGLSIDADASRKAEGDTKGRVKIAGPLEDLLAVAGAFGVAADTQATGRLDGELNGSLAGGKAEAALNLVATDLVVTKPEIGGGPFREPRLALSVPSVRYDTETRVLEPVKARVDMEGAAFDVTASKEGDVVTAEGRLTADEKFARNHAEMLSGAAFRKIDGPFTFKGDVSQGRGLAAGWTGGFTLTAEGVTAPHVNLATAKLPGKIADGVITVEPIEAVLNGGSVGGRATIGLVGEKPEHRLVLDGKDISLDADLAPLLARANPLFAVGENGRTGGKAAVHLDLTAKGFAAEQVKRTLSGDGNIDLDDAFVQSTNWIGELMQFAGQSNKLSIPKVAVPFSVKDSKVVTNELPVEGAGLSMRLGGSAGLDGKLDYLLRLKSDHKGGKFEKLASLLDKDGYLPLRLGGSIDSPKLKLPDVKDALLDRLGGLLDRGGKDDPPPPPPEPRKKKKKSGETQTDPPPPPPPSDEPKREDPPPPPPSAGSEEPPPPPPPGETEEPPPPPPPK
jgi:hypothetical protein